MCAWYSYVEALLTSNLKSHLDIIIIPNIYLERRAAVDTAKHRHALRVHRADGELLGGEAASTPQYIKGRTRIYAPAPLNAFYNNNK